ncbi:unnamed protein product, partial [Rotaria sordida]
MNETHTQILGPGNSLLYTIPKGEIIIPPYWALCIQILSLQLLQRIWNRCRYKTWFTSVEVAMLYRKVHAEDHKPTFVANVAGIDIDIFDLFQSLWPLAHFIWYCILQAQCMTYLTASAWKCYNIFGYKIHNYIAANVVIGLSNAQMKHSLIRNLDYEKKTNTQKHYIAIIHKSVPYFYLVPILAWIPYGFTHILPMFILYIWMFILYIIGILISSVFFSVMFIKCPQS